MKRDDKILTLSEVADYLRLSNRTIYRLLASRELLGWMPGSQWRFFRSDVEAYVRAKRSEAMHKRVHREPEPKRAVVRDIREALSPAALAAARRMGQI